MRIEKITSANAHVHINLAQIYEATFAPLTGALPDADGLFSQHTTRVGKNCFGYLLYYDDLPGGFAIFRHTGDLLLVEELFVCPHLRRQHIATGFLALIAQCHPCTWDIRQLEAASHSRAFWRWWAAKIDSDYTEDIVVDAKWGTVTRQLVRVSLAAATSLALEDVCTTHAPVSR